MSEKTPSETAPSENEASFDPAALADADAADLAAVAGSASDDQLAEAMGDPDVRKKILDEIFNRMADHVDPAQVKDLDATIRFVITDAPGGGEGGEGDDAEDVYEASFKDGAVTVSDSSGSAEPKVTLIAGPVPFLKLVTGQESGPAMFMTGKLKIKGDLMFASRMSGFFRIPSAA